jgi:hypothetical protein
MRTLGLIFLLGAGGCYLKPTRTNNPLHSREGVRLRLVGLDCEDHRGSDGDPVSRDLAVRLEVSNPTAQPLDFAPDAVRLTAGDEPVAGSGGDFERVAPGATRVFTMKFVHHAYCDRDFALAFDHAMRLAGQPVAMAVLHFTP